MSGNKHGFEVQVKLKAATVMCHSVLVTKRMRKFVKQIVTGMGHKK